MATMAPDGLLQSVHCCREPSMPPLDPSQLGENLRANRLQRTRQRQETLRKAQLREADDAAAAAAAAGDSDPEGEDGAAATVAAGWGQEFVARQVQRRANKVRL